METATETVTVTKYVLTLTETEVAAALVDPTALQQALRDARGESASRKNGYGRHYPKPKKEKPARAPKGAAGKGKFKKQPCPECGQMIAGSQMRQHRARKHGVGAVKSSESN